MLSAALKRVYELDNGPRSICKICGVNFERPSGKKRPKFCSQECIDQGKLKIKKCKPKCLPENLITRKVFFKDGGEHLQQFCKMCLLTSYVSRDANKKESFKGKIYYQSKALKEKYGDSFYVSEDWLKLKYKVFKTYGKECMCCGRTEGNMHVDHIKPRSKYPQLSLDFNNLQVLCYDCNIGKGNWDETDWRPKTGEKNGLRI